MSVEPPGNYEIALSAVTMALALPLVVLFWSNRRLYPIAQREPALALAAAGGQVLMVSEWFIDSSVPEIPYVFRKILSQICFFFVFGGFWFRAWKLWMDAGLAQERVANRLIVTLLWGSWTNLLPARVGTVVDPAVYFFVIIIFLYFLSFVVWSFLLSKAQDGFFIKTELRLVGSGCGFATAVWFFWLIAKLPCSFPNCRVFILWISMVWMVTWTIAFPLKKAMKDPRFSYTAWLRCPRRHKRSQSTDQGSRSEQNSDSDNSRSESMDDYNFSEPSRNEAPIRKLSVGTLAKLRRVNLASFLSYPAGREAFREFTVKEFSVENLLFIEAVQQFNSNAQRTKEDCEALFAKFIADSGENQINLPGVMAQRITARISDIEAGDTMQGLFDEASHHIMKLMQRDAYKRFQHTEAWMIHVAVFKVEPKQKAAPAADVSTTADTDSSVHSEPGSEGVSFSATSALENPMAVQA